MATRTPKIININASGMTYPKRVKRDKPFDKYYKADDWGRMSRYFYKQKSIEKIGLEYKKGRGYKIIVDNIGDIGDKAIIRQIFAYEGVGPKIYKLGKFTGYDYFEVEHIKKDLTNPYITEKIEKILEKYPFILPYMVDVNNSSNYIADKYVDFHGFQLNRPKFKKWIMDEINDKTHWGHLNDENKRHAYQLEKRDMKYRIKQMKLDTLNFRNMRVLDMGCNLGLFLHYVAENGGEGVGFDIPEIMNLASIYRFWTMPYADIEFRELEKDDFEYGFDVQLYLAMVHTFGYPEPVAPLTIFEGHNLQTRESVENELKKKFKIVKFINFTEDRGIRPVFWCWR